MDRTADAQDATTRSTRQRPTEAPLVPPDVLDAPSQRFYISSFYLALTAWKLYDYFKLVSEDIDSLWLFMKWVAIDGVFLYSLPELKVPWLTWSFTATTVIFFVHAISNAVLMFRITIPLESWIFALTKMLYDREIAVSERRVKTASLLHNPSLIIGKQIVNILPEGLAVLNPNSDSACLHPSGEAVILPILVNQTIPTSIMLIRIDSWSGQNETLEISSKECRTMKKQADKEAGKRNSTSLRMLRHPVQQTGLYRLLRVIDESSLEVRIKHSEMLVVSCPKASVKATSKNKCQGDLSDFHMLIDGTPPLKVNYSKVVNGEKQSHVLLNVHPDRVGGVSPSSKPPGDLRHVSTGDIKLSWAQTRHMEVPLNETLGESGSWIYSIDEIHDGLGNHVHYTTIGSPATQRSSKDVTFEQHFSVRERPSAALKECSPQEPLRVAIGSSRTLPIWLNPQMESAIGAPLHYVTYAYSPILENGMYGDQQPGLRFENVTLGQKIRGPLIHEPGRYTLKSVSTEFCTGDILEPSSCLLLNPPEPALSISHEEIPHKCAGNSIGLKVSLDFIGTPPFHVSYNIVREGGGTLARVESFDSMRAHMELRPPDAGHYTYEFLEIMDSVYKKPRALSQKSRLQQDVKPTASATFSLSDPHENACIGESTAFSVDLVGESPWTLEYDVVHGGKREKHKAKDIVNNHFILETPRLHKGGLHTLAIAAVTDASGCRISLQQEAQIHVRHQRPSASFGAIEGKRHTSMLQGKNIKLPIRLSGEAPWTLTYRVQGDLLANTQEKRLHAPNDVVSVSTEGLYEILNVRDAFCPGSVDESAATFKVAWVPRPSLQIQKSSSISKVGTQWVKNAVCEGDSDTMSLAFMGSPPFSVRYEIGVKPNQASVPARSTKKENFALGSASIRLETSRAGQYVYRFTELGDQLYDHDNNNFSPFLVQQRVDEQPSGRFEEAGKTYGYCKESAAENEGIPIRLTGSQPFSLEMAVRHNSASKPEIVNVPHVEGSKFLFHVPHQTLSHGMHFVSIRTVRDGNGCHRSLEYDGPVVRVNVADVPSISPVEPKTDFCVGDRIAFNLAGTPPFNVFYDFEGVGRRASASSTFFRRIAERPGNFTITAVTDKASSDICRAPTAVTHIIHGLPSVQISRGRTTQVDIHEGGKAEILFEFGGTPPFEFTYTRSTNAARGKRSVVLETRSDISFKYIKAIQVSEEGTYEVISIRDKFCVTGQLQGEARPPQQLLTL